MKSMKHVLICATLFSMALPAMAKIPVTVQMPKQARPGDTVTVCVKTERDAKCKIEAQNVGLTQALKLIDQTADTSGAARWKFDLPKNYKANEMPVIITVTDKSGQEKVTKSIAVKK